MYIHVYGPSSNPKVEVNGIGSMSVDLGENTPRMLFWRLGGFQFLQPGEDVLNWVRSYDVLLKILVHIQTSIAQRHCHEIENIQITTLGNRSGLLHFVCNQYEPKTALCQSKTHNLPHLGKLVVFFSLEGAFFFLFNVDCFSN